MEVRLGTLLHDHHSLVLMEKTKQHAIPGFNVERLSCSIFLIFALARSRVSNRHVQGETTILRIGFQTLADELMALVINFNDGIKLVAEAWAVGQCASQSDGPAVDWKLVAEGFVWKDIRGAKTGFEAVFEE